LMDLFCWFFINAKWVGFKCAFEWRWLTIVMGLEIQLELSWGLSVYTSIIFLQSSMARSSQAVSIWNLDRYSYFPMFLFSHLIALVCYIYVNYFKCLKICSNVCRSLKPKMLCFKLKNSFTCVFWASWKTLESWNKWPCSKPK
jgi:hypothetical protein